MRTSQNRWESSTKSTKKNKNFPSEKSPSENLPCDSPLSLAIFPKIKKTALQHQRYYAEVNK